MPDHLVWLRVSHVCHQWRDIALNQPVFWSHVDFTNISSAGAAEILARAKTTPLYLEARCLGGHWDNAQFRSFREQLQLRVSRIRHLVISAKLHRLFKTLEGIISPAPILESLSLSNEERTYQDDPVLETLFGGMTPRLSSLKLNNYGISWESSLLKGLQCLEIRSPPVNRRPNLSVWLGTLDQMRQLETLTLHSASPIAPPRRFPLEVQSTVTLPSLTHLDISGSTRDCALALAHLDLPALTGLRLEAIADFHEANVQTLLSYVVRHAHGSQDTQPLQSALIRDDENQIDILAWTVPNIDIEVHDALTLLTATVPTRVTLSFTSSHPLLFEARMEITCAAMVALPLDGLVTLIVKEFMPSSFREVCLRTSPKWPLLRRIQWTGDVSDFLKCLLVDKGGCKNPLLPSLQELVLVDSYVPMHYLCQALMKCVEQGVPLETIELRTCQMDSDYPAAIRLLGEKIEVDILGSKDKLNAKA